MPVLDMIMALGCSRRISSSVGAYHHFSGKMFLTSFNHVPDHPSDGNIIVGLEFRAATIESRFGHQREILL